jgi:uncharacterized protein YbjT (DUF2867 family)
MMAQLVWEGNSRVGVKILLAQSKAEKIVGQQAPIVTLRSASFLDNFDLAFRWRQAQRRGFFVNLRWAVWILIISMSRQLAERSRKFHALCIDILGLPAYPTPRISKCDQ